MDPFYTVPPPKKKRFASESVSATSDAFVCFPRPSDRCNLNDYKHIFDSCAVKWPVSDLLYHQALVKEIHGFGGGLS